MTISTDRQTKGRRRIKLVQLFAYPKNLAEEEGIEGCDCPIDSCAHSPYQHVGPFWSINFQNPPNWGRFNFFFHRNVLVLEGRGSYINHLNFCIDSFVIQQTLWHSQIWVMVWLVMSGVKGLWDEVICYFVKNLSELLATMLWLGWDRSSSVCSSEGELVVLISQLHRY